MNQLPLNPFRPTRWEHQQDGNQLIWFTSTANNLVGEKSIYVSGSRGSGKTTLLKSICWEDLARNSSLRMQRKLEDFGHISVYIRFPDHLTAAMSFVDWLQVYPSSPKPEIEFHRFFSLLVELTCCERALQACHELRTLSLINLSPSDERAISEGVLLEFPRLRNFSDNRVTTFYELSRVLRGATRQMNEATGRGTISGINEMLPSREPGEILSFVSGRLSAAIRLVGRNASIGPGFKFCLDDCEVLSTPQQMSINTLVRTAKHPVSWVVSYVGSLFENSRTFLEQQPLTDADRRVISLDYRDDVDFRGLCQAVVSLRLMFSVSESARVARPVKNVEDFFPLNERLGNRSVNGIIAQILRKSTSPVAKRIEKNAEILRRLLLVGQVVIDEEEADALPLYQAYVLLHWHEQAEAFRTYFTSGDEEDLERRAQSILNSAGAAWLRRKQRAALLHLSSRLGFQRLPLSGANIVVSLADGSIRDFLEILGFIYEAYAKKKRLDTSSQISLDKFALARTTIAASVQTAGIYKASAAYHAGVSARGERDFDVVLRLIEGLGRYTAVLQSDHKDPSVMGRAERGIFQVRFEAIASANKGHAVDRERAVWSTIRQAEVAGYLRMVNTPTSDLEIDKADGRVLRFRLHRRLAPYFGFSYRGPYEMTGLTASDIWLLCDRSNPIDPVSWSDLMATKPSNLDQSEFVLNWVQDQ